MLVPNVEMPATKLCHAIQLVDCGFCLLRVCACLHGGSCSIRLNHLRLCYAADFGVWVVFCMEFVCVLWFCFFVRVCVCVWQVETLEEGTRRWAVAAGAARARRRGGARVRHHAVSNALFA